MTTDTLEVARAYLKDAAELNQVELPLKDRWNFHVTFELPEELQQHAAPIERMIAAVDLGAENLSRPNPDIWPQASDEGLWHRSSRVIIWLYDDLNGEMMRAIRQLQRAAPTFTMRVGLCGELGFPELEEYTFTGATFECIQHSLLSYEDPSDTVKMKGYVPGRELGRDGYAVPPKRGEVELTGSIRSAANRSVSMKLLQVAFTGMTHEFFNQV